MNGRRGGAGADKDGPFEPLNLLTAEVTSLREDLLEKRVEQLPEARIVFFRALQ